jgi:hypothetical protein
VTLPSSASGARALFAPLKRADLPEFSFGSRSGVIANFFKKGLTANFFKKSLIKNSVTFGFESLIPKPYPA